MRQRHSCISHGSNVEHNALQFWNETMCNAQCNNSKNNLFFNEVYTSDLANDLSEDFWKC